MAQCGCRPLAVCDAEGTIYNPNGIDVDALTRYAFENPANLKHSVVGFPEAEAISKKEFFELKADMLVPAALGGEITADVAERLKVSLVVEAATGATVPEAEEILRARRIEVIPDILANSGGVTMAYFEWLQNERMEHWSAADVRARLERNIRANYRIVRDVACNQPSRGELHDSRTFAVGKEVDMRLAAMAVALKRIEAHYMLEGFSQ
jgi:glutamate dehydrogenase (NAD(P)+)